MLTWSVFSQRGRSISMVGPAYGFAAALFTRMSIAPKRSSVASRQASASSGLPTLPVFHAMSPPISLAAASQPSALRDTIITLAPASTKRLAIP